MIRPDSIGLVFLQLLWISDNYKAYYYIEFEYSQNRSAIAMEYQCGYL